MRPDAVLSKIPQEIQRIYDIDTILAVQIHGDVMGGRFTFENRKGDTVSADAVEFCGTNIEIRQGALKIRIFSIPPDLQKKWEVDGEVLAVAVGCPEGGRYFFMNRFNKEVMILTQEISGTEIRTEEVS